MDFRPECFLVYSSLSLALVTVSRRIPPPFWFLVEIHAPELEVIDGLHLASSARTNTATEMAASPDFRNGSLATSLPLQVAQ